MELKLYDTLTREKRVFTPLDPRNVRMYVCGPTVYDFAHIGNARPVIVFDVLFRLLRHLYGPEHVTYVRNITDVDDKINARAAERGISIRDLTEETYKNFKSDVEALGCLPPTVEPRATEHIAQMKALIERLVGDGHAYVGDGHVLFNVPSMSDYGQLSKRPMDEMIAGARVEVAPYKKDPQDFVLWKPSKPGEPAWPSPCGIETPGRPGWHIECSAMSDYWLWDKAQGSLSPAGLAHPHQFDIHGGGIDLVFPHHENEIAQSRCAFHTPVMANYWMHNGFLQVEGEKMSKSLGNFVIIRDLLNNWPGDVLRLQMLMTHYRQPIDWTESNTHAACNELEEWAHLLQSRYTFKNDFPPTAVAAALADDLNTPNAVSELRDLFTKAKKGGFDDEMKFAANCKLLGFQHLDKPGYFQSGVQALNVEERIIDLVPIVQQLRAATANNAPQSVRTEIVSSIVSRGLNIDVSPTGIVTIVSGDRGALEDKIQRLIAERTKARVAKNWKESDRIRDELAAMGVVLKDSKDGTTWEIAR
jgi:cysteinyl-tRNA synthetase